MSHDRMIIIPAWMMMIGWGCLKLMMAVGSRGLHGTLWMVDENLNQHMANVGSGQDTARDRRDNEW